MRSAIGRACALLGVESFAKDLDHDVSSSEECVVGLERGATARAWFHRFCTLGEHLAPSVAPLFRENFTGILSRRVRALDLADSQGRVFGGGGRSIVPPCVRAGARPPELRRNTEIRFLLYRVASPRVLVPINSPRAAFRPLQCFPNFVQFGAISPPIAYGHAPFVFHRRGNSEWFRSGSCIGERPVTGSTS